MVPFLHLFTPAQNTALLDIVCSTYWTHDAFRLQTGSSVLFQHGKPTSNLIDQVIRRCLSWTLRYEELDQLLWCVIRPIQKFWPDIAGTRLLDLAFVLLSPGRKQKPKVENRTVPGDKILEVGIQSLLEIDVSHISSWCRDRLHLPRQQLLNSSFPSSCSSA